MNRVVKLNSLQSGAFSANKNLLDFELPARQLDLEKSYINLVCSTTAVDVSGATGAGIYNYQVKWGGENYSVPNASLVKHARLESESHGILEDIRRVDILRTQMKQYTENFDDDKGQNYRQLFQPFNQGNIKCALGTEFFGEGSTKSIVRNTEVQIPMKDIFELGRMDHFPADKMAGARVHLEMNFDKIQVSQLQGAGSRTANGGLEFGATFFTEMENFGVAVGDVGEATNPYITKQAFMDIADSPYWVGQKLTASGTKRTSGTPSGTVTIEAVITSINRIQTGANKNKLEIALATRLTNCGANEDVIDITLDGVDAQSITFSVLEAELVLSEVDPRDYEKMDSLQYSTFLNEEDNGSGLTSFSRQYSCPSSCFNLYVLPVDNGDLLPVNTNSNRYESHRILNNNVFLTNRKVETYSPLYYDQIGKTLLNANMPLRNLSDINKSVASSYDNRFTSGKKLFFMGTPLPLTPSDKQVQLQIDGNAGSGGVGKLELYKQIVKEVSL